ncbi:Malonyl CoA-acyl carrier protein transacylase [Fulvivirga imtechensis AK7]|uniref:Malonyl CoA-acyl carrier protein transacylase n=1 Tax=Fulvivirga imtechensis AK7 TaxID=1237149 RepID=L8JYK7_9BACT|nr:type I polyketide synthase [Fulvivirga imtechensis]ELR72272.1 Malonyl CoA-acyl carrier protein transacylase [Fulvivirga imtechensis AK7]
MSQREYNGLEIAVIGMACRFPKSPNVKEFWKNLMTGKECITIDHVNNEKGRIKAKGILEYNECFDFDFFGYSPNEAEFMDPQIRILHECTWEALEDAGYNPFEYNGLIGNYVGASTNPTSYMNPFLRNGNGNHDLWSNLLYSDKDFISTRISHKLNLRGPSFTIDTACSTSLSAVDVATQGLLTGKCDIAIAGGVSITYHDEEGYVYKEGFINSPDGHCRAFDAEANGTVTGNGAGLVVLKRLDDAIKDGDRIDAVILASSMNNDGANKLGYTAPSRKGQIEVIKNAYQMAEIDAESIGYVEAHGTGTQVGDPVEIDALKIAFNTQKRNYCAIGAVKTNIGHLDTAAGIAGLIKTVLVLKNKQIPPTLHFKTANSKFDLENSPFFINSEPLPWESDGLRRRAAVSSFGMGGTNLHVVLEEAPLSSKKKAITGDIFLLTARYKSQLDELKNNFATYLKTGPVRSEDFNNIAHTMRVGRCHFKYRLAIQADSLETLADKLDQNVTYGIAEKSGGKVAFMFSGQGSQYVNMTRQLYLSNEYYRTDLENCFSILNRFYDEDVKSIVFNDNDVDNFLINNTLYTQPILVAVEYCLAQLLIRCGLKPDIVIGHSVGEYAAACIAGIFSLEDTLKIVSKRAQLMNSVEGGAMLSLKMEKGKLLSMLTTDLSLAAENSDNHLVISGSFSAIEKFKQKLEENQHSYTELKTSHAFHSSMMLPIMEAFEEVFAEVEINEPELCYVSNVTGRAIGFDDISRPSYWSSQIVNTVLFKECINSAVDEGATLFLEIGPGLTLQIFAKAGHTNINTLGFIRHPNENVNDFDYLLQKLGVLWETGSEIHWNVCLSRQLITKVSLPTYPFEKNKIPVHRINFENISESGIFKTSEQEEEIQYYAPLWEQSILAKTENSDGIKPCVIFSFDIKKDKKLITTLRQGNGLLIIVEMTEFYKEGQLKVSVDSKRKGDYQKALKKVEGTGAKELKIIFSCSKYTTDQADTALYSELESFILLVQSLASLEGYDKKNLYVITHGQYNVLNERTVNQISSSLVGVLKVVEIEQKEMRCVNIDFDKNFTDHQDQFKAEVSATPVNGVVAYRNGLRWTPVYRKIEPPHNSQKLKQGGTYVITGGVGGMASSIARHLLENYGAHVVIIGRSEFLSSFDWATDQFGDNIASKYHRRIKELVEISKKSSGTITSYSANISDKRAIKEIFGQVISERGGVNGIFHTAGVIDYGGVVQRRSFNSYREVMEPKVEGTQCLVQVMAEYKLTPDFTLLFSSNGNTLYAYKYGQSAYNAANEYLDTLAADNELRERFNIKTINWNDWYEIGMTIDSLEVKHGIGLGKELQDRIDDGLSPQEGLRVIEKVLNLDIHRVIISRKDVRKEVDFMNYILENNKDLLLERLLEHSSSDNRYYKKPEINTEYQPPRTIVEETIIEELRKYLKYDDIGIYDNFFELGLSSLDLVQLSYRLGVKLNKSVSVTTLFTYPTVDTLSRNLGHEENEERKESEVIPDNEDFQNSLSLFK